MDFSLLPDNVFLQIFEYFPMEDCTRIGRVNKLFHRMSQLTISRTKCLDLANNRFRKLNADQLAVILDLCSPSLEKINFPPYYMRSIPSSLLAPEFATTLSNYECPRLTHMELSCTPINYDVFQHLIRNNSNLERLSWHGRFVGFPMVTRNNLKNLYLCDVNDVTLQSMTGRMPNLKELYLIDANVTANVLDEFFASTPHIRVVELRLVANQIVFDESLVNFWKLPLTFLNIKLNGGIVLHKVATSFSHLRTLLMSVSHQSTHGISALADLQELKILQLDIARNATDHNDHEIRALVACKQLQSLTLSQSIVTAGTLITLLRGCPLLDTVHIYDIDQVATPDEAAVFLECMSRIAKRDLQVFIRFNRDDAEMQEWFQSIWESEAVEEAMKKVEENQGFQIRLDWLHRPEPEYDGVIDDE